MAVFGKRHQALTDWLKDEWWLKGPPVCIVSGFPGTGKTEIAVQAMNALKQAQPTLPIAFFNCIEDKGGTADDLLLTITEELAADGDREPLERLERGEDVAAIFNRILMPPRLIVADEAQRLLVGSTGAMPKPIGSFLERWSQTVGGRGRLLLLSSREFDFARWSGQVAFRKLGPLEPQEAEAFLRTSLQEAGRTEAVPQHRNLDVVTWLGCNPRAIKLLVSALARESLDDLIDVAAEAWEARDRNVSPELLHDFEEAILNRAEERLDAQARLFLTRLSVLRQPADGRVLQALRPDGRDVGQLRDELISRFMLELRRNWYEMHPVLRDTIRARMTAAERRRAHLGAGRYYAAPFRARRTLGTAERLGARFIEARYHFTLAESQADLDDISQRFEAHYRTQFGPNTPVPADPQQRDERIALLSALLQARGAKGLEYHLARCLVARNQPGDWGRALPHARRATGPQSPEAAWVLRIQIEAREFGGAQAAKIAREGALLLPPEQITPVYNAAGEILARDGKSDEAVELLRQGIKEAHNAVPLYQAAGEILAQAGRPNEAIELLRQGIKEVPREQNLFSLYLAAGEILARDGKSNEAIEFLRQGIKEVRSDKNLFSLYQAAGEILARDGKPNEAIELLRQGLKEVPREHNRHALYHAAGEILAQAGKPDEAAELLRQGIKDVPDDPNLFSLYQALGEILARAGKPDEAIDCLLDAARKIPEARAARLLQNMFCIALAEKRVHEVRSAGLAAQAVFLEIIAALEDDDPERAARAGTKALPEDSTNLPVVAQTAFAWLSAGEPTKADETLRKYARAARDVAGFNLTWLRSFIALERGALDEAKRLAEIYLGDGLAAPGEFGRPLLLRLWDISPSSKGSVAFYFPRLVPRLTGLGRTVVRRQYGGPVLTEDDLRLAGQPRGAKFPAVAEPVKSIDATRILIALRPDRWNGLYILGCYDKTKTVYVQQCRALTLVHALFEAGELQEGSRLGIIGGGAAGATAAAAAARKGAKVLLFERAEHLLPLQRQNTKRYIHPHLFDWPATRSVEPQAGLPLLDWRANRSDAVAAEIGRGFEEVVRTSGNVELRLGTGVQDVAQVPSADERRRVQILGAEGDINEIVDVAIIAVGFGLELRNRLGIESRPYWEDDGLDQALGGSPDRPQRILVSGAGDGALIDLLRATIRDFRHEHVLNLLPEDDALRKLQEELQAIESKARRMSLVGDGRLNLQEMYSGLKLTPTFLDQMRERIRDDTDVCFNFSSAGRYTLGSSILNRFLVSILTRVGAIRPKLARLDEKGVMLRPDGKYAVTWPRATEPEIFDRMVIRHGPPGDYLAEVFPELEIPCAPLRGKLRDLDLTGSLDEATRAYFTRFID